MAASKRLVFPLDVPSLKEAEGYVRLLSDIVGAFKVGLELFCSSGPGVAYRIKELSPDTKLMLDLKLHDIPSTVGRTLKVLEKLPVDFVTLHIEPGYSFSTSLKLIGVTVLTSIGGHELSRVGIDERYSKDPSSLVVLKASLSKELGFSGVVCSGKEALRVKESLGSGFLVFTPGVRPSWWGVKDDQSRVVTPREAVLSGADYVIVGRPIKDSNDPRKAALLVAEEICEAEKEKEENRG